jgi:putative ATPase
MKYSEYQPLADRIRPQSLADFVGQTDVVGEGKLLRRLIEKKDVSSLIFWGPPGVGKTTLANLIANELEANFVALSAVESGKKDLQQVIEAAKADLTTGKRTLLFIDEIHRWNKAQQDALLPYVEKGIVTLIGATTENPSFEIIGALLSRSQVIVLKKLTNKDITTLIVKRYPNLTAQDGYVMKLYADSVVNKVKYDGWSIVLQFFKQLFNSKIDLATNPNKFKNKKNELL